MMSSRQPGVRAGETDTIRRQDSADEPDAAWSGDRRPAGHPGSGSGSDIPTENLGSGADRICLNLPASLKYLNIIGGCLKELLVHVPGLADAETAAYEVQLAVHEICVNIVTHAYRDRHDGRLQVVLHVDEAERRLTVELHDTGAPFDPSTVPEPNLDGAQVHGYGLFIARETLDDVIYQPLPDGNRWCLLKSL